MEFDTTQIVNQKKDVSLTVKIAHGSTKMPEESEGLRGIEARFVRNKAGRRQGESYFDADPETEETFIGIMTPPDPTGDIAPHKKCFFSGGGFDPGYSAAHTIRDALRLASNKGYKRVIFNLTGIDMAMMTSFKKLKEGLALYLGETREIISEILFLVEPSGERNNPRYGGLLKAFGIMPTQAASQASPDATRPKKHHKKRKSRQPGMV